MRPVVLVKLGGSLITRKDRPDTPRLEVIDRLAREIAEAWPGLEGGLVLGHGSGSFGHAAAHEFGLLGDGASGRAPNGSSEGVAQIARGAPHVQRKAAELHALVMAALREADLPAFSIAPSSAATASSPDLPTRCPITAGPSSARSGWARPTASSMRRGLR